MKEEARQLVSSSDEIIVKILRYRGLVQNTTVSAEFSITTTTSVQSDPQRVEEGVSTFSRSDC